MVLKERNFETQASTQRHRSIWNRMFTLSPKSSSCVEGLDSHQHTINTSTNSPEPQVAVAPVVYERRFATEPLDAGFPGAWMEGGSSAIHLKSVSGRTPIRRVSHSNNIPL